MLRLAPLAVSCARGTSRASSNELVWWMAPQFEGQTVAVGSEQVNPCRYSSCPVDTRTVPDRGDDAAEELGVDMDGSDGAGVLTGAVSTC